MKPASGRRRRSRTGVRTLDDVRRGGDGEQVALRLSLLHHLERLPQGCVEGQIATFRRRVAGNETRNALLEQAVDVAAGGAVLRAIEHDTLGREAAIELVAPLRLHLEVLVCAT